MNYSIFETSAFSMEELNDKVASAHGFTVTKDATSDYKKASKKEDFNPCKFFQDWLNANCQPGEGACVSLITPIKDSKVSPTKVIKSVRTGRAVRKKAYEIVDSATNEIYKVVGAKTDEDGVMKLPTRALAIKMAREVAKEKRASLNIREVALPAEPIVAEVKYEPSVKTRIGNYLVFGLKK